MPDPYRDLGISPDASLKEICDAYRQASKRTHPDAGGTAEEFQKIKEAFDTLSDPARRAHFDRTGEQLGAKPDTARAKAMNLVAAAVQNVLRASEGAAGAADFPMGENVLAWIEENQKRTIAILDKTLLANKNLKRLIENTKRKDGEPSEIAALLRTQLEAQERMIAEIRSRADDVELAMEIIEAHDFGDPNIVEVFDNLANYSGTSFKFVSPGHHKSIFGENT